jgi:hypothetical protein
MKEVILSKAHEVGLDFADHDRKYGDDLDKETLLDAILTGHVMPDELGEVFIWGVLENLGLENNLTQRREDKIEAIQEEMFRSFEEGLLGARPSKKDIRAVAERIVDAVKTKR